jgi:hypothetical protein
MNISKQWLTEQLTREEILNSPLEGGSIETWRRIMDTAKPTDEFWKFNNGGFMSLAGRKGYVLVRDGEIIDYILTAMS